MERSAGLRLRAHAERTTRLTGTSTSAQPVVRFAGHIVDRHGALRALWSGGGLFCAGMVAFCALWVVRPVPVVLVAMLLVCWSAAAWAVPPAIQALMIDRVGPEGATQAMALHSSSVYVGAALGGALGGTLVGLDAGLLPLAAALLVGLALGLVGFTLREDRVLSAREPKAEGSEVR
ncbi:MFS transporter [Streptomyces anulatus]